MTSLPTLDQIRQLPRCYDEVIPASYLDEMDHMNVMWFTHLFSRGFRALLEEVGFDQQFIEQQQIGTFALEKHVRYRAEVRVAQQASVYVRLVDRTDKLLHLTEFLVNESTGRLAATLETINACVDLQTRSATQFPEAACSKLDTLLADHRQLEWLPPLCGAMGLRHNGR